MNGTESMRMAVSVLVGVVMGSDSDLRAMQRCLETLARFGIPHEVSVLSAHRSPDDAAAYAKSAAGRGLRVLIAAAGGAAHLAGALAAHTCLPVLGVPLSVTPLSGLDSLLATVQMPPGVPVATLAVGEFGAENAAILAAQILALSDPQLRERLAAHKAELADKVRAKNAHLRSSTSAPA
jgi:phosphoribosylaminoimidazole carboxylase PurE protein